MVEITEKPVIRSSQAMLRVSPRANWFLSGAKVLGSVFAAILVLIATLATVEFIFSLCHVGEDAVYRPDALLGYWHLQNQTVTFRSEGYSRSTINSQGFRDQLYAVPKPTGVKRVCIVGDSMTMGLEVPLANTFPKLLENRLKAEGRNIEVLNCGISGSGTGQQYLGYLQSIVPLQPDMLIVAYHLGDNDDNVGGGTNPPRPTFLLSGSKQLQVDYSDVDKWLASPDSRFYSSFDWLRRNCRILSVLSKLDLDLHSDPTYKILNKLAGKPWSLAWSKFLLSLPLGNWNVATARAVCSDMLPQTANAKSVAQSSVNTKPLQAVPAFAPASPQKPAAKMAARTPILTTFNQPENGDLDAYKGLLYVHSNRMAVTKEIFRRLNEDCRKNHCQLVVAGLPAFDNSIMYYRELNELRQLASKEHFTFINSCQAFPPRGPLDDSPFHFQIHFNRAGHARFSEQLYQALFASTAK